MTAAMRFLKTSPLLAPLRGVYRTVYTPLHAVLRSIAYVYLFVEYAFCIARRAHRLRAYTHVYPFWCVSFGHQALDLYMLSMRLSGKKLLVLYSDYGVVNRFIADSFRPFVDIDYITHSRLACALMRTQEFTRFKNMKFRIVRFFLRVVGSSATLVWDCNTQDRPRIEGRYMTELITLIRDHPDIVVSLPKGKPEECKKIFQERVPSSTWCVALYLRKKRSGGKMDVRDTEPTAYRSVIERIGELGGTVFCGGDYDPHVLFPEMNHLFGYADFPCTRQACDAYFLSSSTLFIGTHSGPLIIANAFSIPSLITNCGFFYLSGYRSNQRIIYKRLREITSKRVLSAQETFSFPVVAYAQSRENEFALAGLEPVDNIADELLPAAEEVLQEFILHTPVARTAEDEERERRFRALLPTGSVAQVSPCRPCKSYLEALAW